MTKKGMDSEKLPQIIFWVTAFFMMIFGLGGSPLWASEDRWAEIARQMLTTGDWFHPAINGEVYFDKPLLSYWPIVLLAKITGILNEFIIRLPSAVSALIALYGTMKLATKMWGRQVGIASGWLLLSGYGFIFQGRLAAADMMNMTAVVLAVLCFFNSKDKAGFWSYLLFWIICFCGALTKGLPALVLPPILVGIYVLLDGTWKKHLKISNSVALLIGLLIFLSTFFISSGLPLPEGFQSSDSGLTGLEPVWRENVVRVFNPFDHNDEPLFIYLLHVPRIMAPWSLLLFVAVLAVARCWKKLDLNTRWLLLVNAVIFLMFSASGSRRWYYILPIAPFLAILIAEYIGGDNHYRWRDWWAMVHCRVFTVVCGLAVLMIPVIPLVLSLDFLPEDIKHIPGIIIWILPMAAVPAFAILTIWREKSSVYTGLPRLWAAPVLAATVIFVGIFAVIYPEASSLRSEKAFAIELKHGLREVAYENIAFFPKVHPKVVFYMDAEKPITVLNNVEELKLFSDFSNGEKYLIAETRSSTLEDILSVIPDLSVEHAEYQERHVPFEKSGARKLKCWKLVRGVK